MRDNYYFSGEINPETVKDFLYFCNGDEKPINFYIDSPGGLVSSYKILLDAINKQDDIIIYPVGEASSCAFYLLINTIHKIDLIDDRIISYVHFPRSTFKIDYNHQIVDVDEDSLKEWKENSKNSNIYKQLIKLKLTPKQKKELLKGKDLLFNYQDLKRILGEKVISS